MPKPRYAIYLAPSPDTPLWRAASRVIGRDAVSGETLPFPDIAPCDAEDWGEATAEPRRYGFHGTLKAPFELAEGRTEASLIEAAEGFAATRHGFSITDLTVRSMKSFVALTPEAPSADLDGLAADCVVAFEPFRAPLSPAERARRVASLTDPRHVASVDRWGYPWVFEDFRFHMTLTGSLPETRREAARAGLADFLGDVARPLAVDAIAIFRQDHRDAPFGVLARFPFAV
jgi:putative phosphonate metabolism protein